jgi:hypothetical protein
MNVPMRPLDFGETLDGAFTLLRRNFATFFAVAFLPQVPLVVIWLVAPAFFGMGNPEQVTGVMSLVMTPYSIFATVLTMGALTWAAAAAYAGEAPGVGDSLRRGLSRFLPIAASTAMIWLAVMLGLVLLIVPGLILMAMFFAAHPVIMLENRGPIDALGRSRALSRGGRMRILGTVLVAWVITLLPAMALWVVAGVSVGIGGAADLFVGGQSAWAVGLLQALGIVISAVTWPFLMIVTVLLYTDRRARTEAPDLEAAADSLLATHS